MRALSIYEDCDATNHRSSYGYSGDCDTDSDHSCDSCDYDCQGIA